MEITTKKSTMVYPAEETQKHRLWSSNLELLMTLHHVPTVYFFRPNGSSNFFNAQVLMEALSKVLVPFYPMAGRLARDEKGRVEINCNAEGALFVEAETDVVIDDLIGDTIRSSELWRLVPTVDYAADISSYPLTLLQVTKFKCGGVCLGIGLQHTLADGPAGIHFINSWAESARGLPLSAEPHIDRSLLRARDPPTPTFHHVEYDPPLSMNTDQEPQSDPETTVSIFKLTRDQLNTLKDKANKDGNAGNYSTYNSLAAHIWRCVKSFPDTAKRIQTILKRMDDEYLRSAIDHMETVPNVRAPVLGARGFQCPNLCINSWVRLPIYEADFGWGCPIWLGPAKGSQDGKTYVLPSPVKDGSLSLATCLDTAHMKKQVCCPFSSKRMDHAISRVLALVASQLMSRRETFKFGGSVKVERKRERQSDRDPFSSETPMKWWDVGRSG
ncbi:Hydroxycinnamoyl-CoA shikimate/quinate hydroxycinnamoyl transferase, putative [Theobroma cacao]|uniref:Hydroxycinnamoyl-CoA shikimate/quinate hydroxycinnamoyl transferase, putative n=1 Tax=Theobroma cacao TaxID=3641 RepID=A0A061GIZ6_THECC|nr:Hydroxycinnamoyl-CoA shikimate/quinate hydroxycinnamoyl transferase, putative [Theobroma cacao]